MPDPTSITTAITIIKNAIDITKAIRSADLSLEKAETKLKLAELYELLAEAKMQVSEIHELLEEKDSEISQLAASLEFRGKTKRIGDAYFELDGNGSPFGDPYCPVCIELSRPATHLIEDIQHFVCGSCGAIFQEHRVREANHMRSKTN